MMMIREADCVLCSWMSKHTLVIQYAIYPNGDTMSRYNVSLGFAIFSSILGFWCYLQVPTLSYYFRNGACMKL